MVKCTNEALKSIGLKFDIKEKTEWLMFKDDKVE